MCRQWHFPRWPCPVSRSLASRVGAYVALTKPRIIELLLITTLPTMIVAQRGLPPVWLMVATLLGGALAAGGANAINMFVDRDIDKLMHRTRNRPLVTGAVTPRNALIFAIALEVVAFVELWAWVNLLSAVLAVSATLFYVFVYTLWLKRTSSQNIVIGGAAGAVPVLVGWAAVTDSLSWTPVVLFAIIFVWTPPHFWALAVKYKDDYQAASVPMLPAVATFKRTAREILFYSVVLVAVSLLLAAVARLGVIYVVSASVLGVGVRRPGRAAVAAGHPEGGHAAVQLLDHLPHPAVRADGGRHLHQALIVARPDRYRGVAGPPADGRGRRTPDHPPPAGPAGPGPRRLRAFLIGSVHRRRPGRRPLRGLGTDIQGRVVGTGGAGGRRSAPDFTLPVPDRRCSGRPRRPGPAPPPPGGPQLLRLVVRPCQQETPLLARTAAAEQAKGSTVQFIGVDTTDPTVQRHPLRAEGRASPIRWAATPARGDQRPLRPLRGAPDLLHRRRRAGGRATSTGRAETFGARQVAAPARAARLS